MPEKPNIVLDLDLTLICSCSKENQCQANLIECGNNLTTCDALLVKDMADEQLKLEKYNICKSDLDICNGLYQVCITTSNALNTSIQNYRGMTAKCINDKKTCLYDDGIELANITTYNQAYTFAQEYYNALSCDPLIKQKEELAKRYAYYEANCVRAQNNGDASQSTITSKLDNHIKDLTTKLDACSESSKLYYHWGGIYNNADFGDSTAKGCCSGTSSTSLADAKSKAEKQCPIGPTYSGKLSSYREFQDNMNGDSEAMSTFFTADACSTNIFFEPKNIDVSTIQKVPKPLEYIQVFTDYNYGGNAKALPNGRYGPNDILGDMNDNISSIKVPEGKQATVYEDTFNGNSYVFEGPIDIPDLGTNSLGLKWDKKITAIIVENIN